MNKNNIFMGLALSLALISCGGGSGSVIAGGGGGGGDGVGSGGTGIGSISGFGSIFVNGVHYDISNAAMTLDDATSLKLGMMVKVTGTSSADFSTGVASQVVSAAELRGSITAIDTVAGTFESQGSTISVDSETVFDAVADLAALTIGDTVQVYGLLGAPGSLRASRVEKLGAAALPVVSGSLENLNTTAQSFKLGTLTITYGSANFVGGLSKVQLVNGMKVRVRSNANPVAGILQATQVQPWYDVSQPNGTAVNLAGIITDYNESLNSFNVLGTKIDARAAQITGGPASAIGDGVKVEISGLMNNGVLVIGKLKIKHIPGTGGPASFNLLGTVGAYTSPANFKVQGQPVDASATGVIFSGGGVGDLKNGAKVTIIGSHVINGVLMADTVTFNP